MRNVDMRCSGLIIDIDGVLTVSWAPIPGAPATLRTLREASVPVVFLTNTTSLSRASVARALGEAGFNVDVEEILTAPTMTAAFLRREHLGARCLVIGSGDVTADLVGINLTSAGEPPDVVVLGGAGPEFDYATLNRVFQLAVAGTPLVAMHRNLSWATRDGLQLDTGAFLGGIEQGAGVTAVTIGKPSVECFTAALELLGIESEEALMVGDDLDADVLGAQAAGIKGVLVRTGKYRSSMLSRDGSRPDQIVDSFADVPALLGLA
jgi:HAD superfamily hydrolase (TIGR01458 family)